MIRSGQQFGTDPVEFISAAIPDTRPTQNDIERASQYDRDLLTAEALPTLSAVVTVLYALFSLGHAAILEPPVLTYMLSASLSTMAVFATLWWMSWQGHVPVSLSHACTALIGVLILGNTAFHIHLSQDIAQSTNIALLLIGIGLVLMSIPWFIGMQALTAITWIVLSQTLGAPGEDVSHYSIMLTSAAAVSVVGFLLRYRAFDRIVLGQKEINRKEAELSLALQRVHAAESAEERTKAKNLFLAKMSHEIRTPLNAIVGFSETINRELMGPIGNPKYKEYIGDIYTAGRHLSDLINDLHDLGLIESDKIKPTFSIFDITEALDTCRTICIHRAQDKNIRIFTDYDDTLLSIVTDAVRFRQIVSNLLNNAIAYTPEDGTVYVRSRLASDGEILVIVEDTGIGMSAAELERATDTFWRADPHSKRPGSAGSGLGLAITSRLAKLLGGRLSLSSEPGQGTTATLHLPLSCRGEAPGSEFSR